MRIHAICSYFGKNYSGWQKQAEFKSIQEDIETVISKILNTNISIQGSGRTDSGVHANNQHFHFDVEKEVDLSKLMHSMNAMLSSDIKIKSLEYVSEDFHSRFSAKSKEYIYKICNVDKDPFKTDLYWIMKYKFDLDLFKKALSLFVGSHNFMNFTSKETDLENFVRNIEYIKVENNVEETLVYLKANGFMRYQIRFLIGSAMAVGQKMCDISLIENLLLANSTRQIINYKAPSAGLYLNEVFYE